MEGDLWRAEVLAPLRAEHAMLQGRVHEQEETLNRAALAAEHAAAKQRQAERRQAEATQRADWLEGKLDGARRAAELAAGQIEKLQTAELRARDAARAAEAEAEARGEQLKISQERLLLIARSHREQEEAAAAATAREVALQQRVVEADRRALEAEKQITANAHAVANAAASEERWSHELQRAKAEIAQSEERAEHAQARFEREIREANERAAVAEARAAAVEADVASARRQRDENARKLDEAKRQLWSHEEAAAEHMAREEELRAKLSRAESDCALLKESHAESITSLRLENERQRSMLSERESELTALRQKLDEQGQQLDQRRTQLQKTAALGMQLQDIHHMLAELSTDGGTGVGGAHG
jgi:chromosome segregation ATPase